MKKLLLVSAILTLTIGLLHLIIPIIGYQGFIWIDAEELAKLYKNSKLIPSLITTMIGSTLIIFSLYGFSGAKIIKKLPYLKNTLLTISLLFILRGSFIFLFLILYLTNSPFTKINQIYFSSLSLLIGIGYLLGYIENRN